MSKTIEDMKIKDRSNSNLDKSNRKFITQITKDSVNKIKINPEPLLVNKHSHIKKTRRSINVYLIFAFIVSIIIGVTYFASTKFAKLYVVIKEKHQVFNLDHKVFNLTRNSDSPIEFEVMIVPDKTFKDVFLTDSKEVSENAQGTVTLYNEYSTKIQNLPAGTYLSDESGKAYKLDKITKIPAYNKTTKVAGSVVASVSAFLPGSDYNGNPTDFHITSFKKDPTKYAQIYGKALTPMKGGAQGLVYIFNPGVRLESFKNQGVTKQDLLKRVEVPSGYLLYKDATTFSSEIDSGIMSATPDAKVAIDSTLSAILLKRSDLEKVLMNNLLPDITDKEKGEIEFLNLSDLQFNFVSPNQSINKDIQSVNISLTGQLEAVWHPDLNNLTSSLLGISKSSLQSIFKQDVAISNTTTRIFPPWLGYVPNDISKINIKVK